MKKHTTHRRAVLIFAIAALLTATAFSGMILHTRTSPTPSLDTTPATPPASSQMPDTEPGFVLLPPETGSTQTGSTAADTTLPTTAAKSPETTKSPETVSEPNTPDYPVPSSVTYNGTTYEAFLRLDDPAPLTEADLGDAIGEHLYALAGVSTDYMIVFEHDGTLWRYLNRWYRPASMAALIADLNLTENLQIGSLYYETFVDGKYQSWRVDGLDQARLWDMLFAYPDSEPQELWIKIDPEAVVKEAAEQGIIIVSPPYDPTGRYTYPRTPIPALGFSISLPKFGYHNISIQISDEDNGWLWTNILVSGNYFATSPNLVDDVMAYAKANGEWIDTTPVYDPDTTKVPEANIPEPVTVTVESTKAIG